MRLPCRGVDCRDGQSWCRGSDLGAVRCACAGSGDAMSSEWWRTLSSPPPLYPRNDGRYTFTVTEEPMGEVIPAKKQRAKRRNYQRELEELAMYCKVTVSVLEKHVQQNGGVIDAYKDILARLERQ